jgi:serine/threonine protein kinase
MNGDLLKYCEVNFSPSLTVQDIIQDSKDFLGISMTSKCKLFDSGGGELSDDDIDYINPQEPLFLSLGEEFVKNSSLAIYEEIGLLGKGGFGTVKLYRHRINHKEVAIKFIDMSRILSPEAVTRVYKEIQVLRELRHPNIVQLIDAFPLQDQVCFVMEYCRGGELKKYLKENGPLPQEEALTISLQMSEAIRYCHNSKIIHRDLKLENILFADPFHSSLKIVDFGIAGMFSIGSEGEKSNAGSLLYIAPEVLSGRDIHASPSLDIWSMGCIIYYLLTGSHPFGRADTRKDITHNIITGSYTPIYQAREDIDEHWNRLLRGMLRTDPWKRWSLLQVTEHLNKVRLNPNASFSSESSSSGEDIEEVKEPEKTVVRRATTKINIEGRKTNHHKRTTSTSDEMKKSPASAQLQYGLCRKTRTPSTNGRSKKRQIEAESPNLKHLKVATARRSLV